MGDDLTIQDKVFVKEIVITGNQAGAARKAYKIKGNNNYAAVKGIKMVRKANIIKAIESVKLSLAERIPDDLLERVHLEGLEATAGLVPDYSVRHKYLDTAYKLKGSYAPDKAITINIDAQTPEQLAKANLFNEWFKHQQQAA